MRQSLATAVITRVILESEDSPIRAGFQSNVKLLGFASFDGQGCRDIAYIGLDQQRLPAPAAANLYLEGVGDAGISRFRSERGTKADGAS